MTTGRAVAATGRQAAERAAEALDARPRTGGPGRDAFDASVIISTYNCRQELGDMLADLAAQEGAFEVVLVDDGSTDGTAEMLKGLVFPRPRAALPRPDLRLAPGLIAAHLWRKHGRPHGLALLAEIHPLLLPLKWLVYRTGVVMRLLRAVLPWAERRALLPLCSGC